MHMATPTVTAPDPTTTDPDFDLDISIVESGPMVADLMRSTDDGCGSTCQSACTSCRS
jgi:FxLD family lantipeptide